MAKKEINITLRPNSHDGEKVVIKGESNQYPDVDIQGDLILILKQKPKSYITSLLSDIPQFPLCKSP